MYAIANVNIRDLSNISREFERLPYEGYVGKRNKHESNDSYFYLERQLAKCMMRADNLNSHVDPVRTEMTGMQQVPILHVCDLDES